MLKKTALGHALTLAFSASIATFGAQAFAQSAVGGINGNAAAGSTVTIENPSIGVTRTISVERTGRFQLSQLPPGMYTVRIKKPDGSTQENQVVVTAGQNANADPAAMTQSVVVTGRVSRIDVKSPESSLTLNEAAIDRIPVARDVTAVALLAPGATRGDSRIGSTTLRTGNVPSLGGASPAENVYYINGFNVTNNLNGVAFNQVPFEAIAQQQVKTGGYGPEYGRSLGGVLAVTTKRGTNEWHGGVNAIYSPKSLAGSELYAEKSASTGRWNLNERDGGTDDLQANIWAGGPLIKDKLFLFALVQGADIERTTFSESREEIVKTNTPRYLVKADWNINDKNLLELTAFSDKSKDKVHKYVSSIPYTPSRGDDLGVDTYTTGGENYIAKYTSWITDDFTISALAGLGRYNRKSDIASAACPLIQDKRTDTTITYGCSTATRITDPNANDERKAYRIDAEWNLGSHTLRFGADNEKYKVVDGTFYPGGEYYELLTLSPGGELSNHYVNNTGAPINYMSVRHFENGGKFTTKNSAFYIEDQWQVTKNVVLNLGVRSESFENLNADEKTFIKVDNTIAPRLGAVWDVYGNATTKVFGNIGRYYIPVMSNTNVRLAGAELDYTDYYVFNGAIGTDKFQLPGKGAQLGNRLEVSNGQAGDPRSVVDPNIKPMYQDEYILGLEQALNNRWSVGVKATYRKLQSVMDDMCNDEGAYNWAIANGFDDDRASTVAGAIGHCFLYNPGKNLTANIDFGDGKGLTAVTIPASALGFPKPQRIYKALEFTFNRAWDGVWSLQGSYVLAYNKGNTEGYVKSDIGQDDAGISQDWDYPGLMEGAYGYLPNDRRHTLKMWGSYQVSPEWRVGANTIIQSGRPRNCLGYYTGDLDTVSVAYGAASFYCNGTLHPRGSFGRLPWTKEVGLQVAYMPKWVKGLTFQLDVLNLFNNREVTSVDEEGETSAPSENGPSSPSRSYLKPLSLQSPRTFRFMAQYEF
ncbi:TonB-dependent receptor [Herbaspirillum sp. SJZ107]|uniref:TonB-dependent receptor n=1 Tax=Herbaspirillum sp. SJZ107 TaxID=2572881 RepID=UPI001151D4DC|nr:TonB-dependent receptor [Herbaspirillum sp. SJZ107]TQK10089.1 TonB-dependent receptor-like protein [Herbaspirillum sp. SJZ107]